ncbi:MAG: hypothetical protein H6713_17565 [Myxococcales bacterium]|nr:hypothetical protein [Myxococcales bacterium]MCB9751785.1 hypothetical protein [Myxococcales bacterium]
MSLLSDTQGRPERVWSLLRLLQALGGRASRGDVDTWMMPASFRDSDKSLSQVAQTVGSARSLGLVDDDGDELVLLVEDVPATMQGFADLAHYRLCEPLNDADAVVFQAYACVIVETARKGNSDWLAEQKAAEIANFINRVLVHGEDSDLRRFNKEKAPAWRAWLVALGLAFEASALPYLFPQPAERIARELPAIAASLGIDVEIPATKFVNELGRRMPYLDGGSVHKQLADRIAAVHDWRQREGSLSNVLSEALRDLHDEGVIELRARADAKDALILDHDPGSPLRSFVGVVICGGRR